MSDVCDAVPEKDGGSLAGNESSDASSTRCESLSSRRLRRVRTDGINIVANAAPAATAINAHIVREEILM